MSSHSLADLSVSDALDAARSKSRRYDEIAHHLASILSEHLSADGPFIVSTHSATTNHESADDPLRQLAGLREQAQHLSLDPRPALSQANDRVSVRFECDIYGNLRLEWLDNDVILERNASQAHPPKMFSTSASEFDATPIFARILVHDGIECNWLPYMTLVAHGRFVRMQHLADELVAGLNDDCYYVFVSHQWSSIEDPDPSCIQAALLSWQLLAHLVEAIWVSRARGLHAPRQRFDGVPIGIHGSDLAESMIVNLLRRLPDDVYAAAARESTEYADISSDLGVSAGHEDVGLEALRTRLDRTPHIASVLSRIRIWYDYSCIPQEPRTKDEDRVFEDALRSLDTIQMLGRTVILLEDLQTYFERAWCALESMVAEAWTNADVLCGNRASARARGDRAALYNSIARFRSIILSRAVYDTEVHSVQSSGECMTRLGLHTTRPQDRDVVYKLIRDFAKSHSGLGALSTTAGDVITGVLPFPTSDISSVFHDDRQHPPKEEQEVILPFTVGTLRPIGTVLPFQEFPAAPSSMQEQTPSHMAVFGRCEAESQLWFDDLRAHHDVFARNIGKRVCSMSWTAVDATPVGHFPFGELHIRHIEAAGWILVAPEGVVNYCPIFADLWRVVFESGLPLSVLAIQGGSLEDTRAVVVFDRNRVQGSRPSPHTQVRTDKETLLSSHPGGLFRDQLKRMLGFQGMRDERNSLGVQAVCAVMKNRV